MKAIVTIVLLSCSTMLFAQLPHLDVEGHVKIRGNIDIHHMDDATSIHLGKNAGINYDISSGTLDNTFFGIYAGEKNSEGEENCFFGNYAGRNNIGGHQNSFFGNRAGRYTEEEGNSFFGYAAGFRNNKGYHNSFFGRDAGHDNTTGGLNSFFGLNAGRKNKTGNRNTIIGSLAGENNILGNRNTFVGNSSGPSSADSLDRAIAIGYNAQVGCSHCAVIGGTGEDAVNVGIGTSIPETPLDVNGNIRSHGNTCRSGVSGTYGNNFHNIFWTGSAAQLWIDVTHVGNIQLTSDRRLKENIHLLTDNAIDRILALHPLQYQYKNIENTIFQSDGKHYEGFIADELQEIIPSAVNGTKDGLTPDGGIQPQTLNSVPILAVLTKAVQEQQSEIDTLRDENQQLQSRLDKLDAILSKLDIAQNLD